MRIISSIIVTGLLIILCGCQNKETPSTTQASISAKLAEETASRLKATEGGRLVLQSINAHGGLEAWYSAPTSAYTWEYSNADAKIRFKTYLVADNRTRQVYHDLLELGTPDNPQPAQGRLAWDGENAWISPAALTRPNPRFWATTGYYFQSIPFILADPGIRYELLPEEMLDGLAYHMVKASYDDGVGDSPGDTYTLYVNKETSRVDAIRYTVTYGRERPKPDEKVWETLFYYGDYITVDGLTVATRFKGFLFADGKKGEFKNDAWAAKISFRQPFDATKLAMPPDGRVQSMPGK